MRVRVALVTPAPEGLNIRGREVAHILVLAVRGIQDREGLNTLGLAAVHMQAPVVPHTRVPAVVLTPGREGLVMTGLVGLVTQVLVAVRILAQAVAVVAQESVGNFKHRLTLRSKGRCAIKPRSAPELER